MQQMMLLNKTMKKFRIISFILVLVLAASLMAGCNDKKKVETGSKEVVWIVEGLEAADNEASRRDSLKDEALEEIDFNVDDEEDDDEDDFDVNIFEEDGDDEDDFASDSDDEDLDDDLEDETLGFGSLFADDEDDDVSFDDEE